MLAEELGRDLFPRRLARERFHAILAQLEDSFDLVRGGPGAALAIEAFGLINPAPGAKTASQAGLTECNLQALHDRRNTSRNPGRLL